jgi:hypothetical protein
MKAELALSGSAPSLRFDASPQEAIEAASAAMGDHEMSDVVLGAKIAGARGVCDGVVCSGRWGPSASGELDAHEVLWEVSCVCWMNRSTPSASQASPVKSALGAFPWRLPLLSRRWFW